MPRADWTDRALRAFDHYGIDPDGDRYRVGRAQGGGWCEFCAQHSVNTPRVRCDLESARAADMASHGFEASCCAHCKSAYPKMFNRAAICPRCQRAQDKRDAEVRAQLRNRKGRVFGLATTSRVPDGLGCTERLPDWSINWDGNPGHQEIG